MQVTILDDEGNPKGTPKTVVEYYRDELNNTFFIEYSEKYPSRETQELDSKFLSRERIWLRIDELFSDVYYIVSGIPTDNITELRSSSWYRKQIELIRSIVEQHHMYAGDLESNDKMEWREEQSEYQCMYRGEDMSDNTLSNEELRKAIDRADSAAQFHSLAGRNNQRDTWINHLESLLAEQRARASAEEVPEDEEDNKGAMDMGYLYPWEEAPDWAMWAATDNNGRANWYTVKPGYDFSEGLWGYDFGLDEYQFIEFRHDIVPFQSLEGRPSKFRNNI